MDDQNPSPINNGNSGQSVPQPVAQPTPQPVAQPTPQPVVQPTPQPVVQPTPQPVVQPTPQPVAQPTPQPVVQPTPQPVAQPTPSPIDQTPPVGSIKEVAQGVAAEGKEKAIQAKNDLWAKAQTYAKKSFDRLMVYAFPNLYKKQDSTQVRATHSNINQAVSNQSIQQINNSPVVPAQAPTPVQTAPSSVSQNPVPSSTPPSSEDKIPDRTEG